MKQISLFAGVGAFELAGQEYGVETVLSVEIDKYACQVLRKQFNHNVYEGDVRNVKGSDIIREHGSIGIITAGFPCQSFSIAGKRKGFNDITRGTLFFEVARLASEIKPDIILLENVKGLLNHEKGRTFGIILQSLSDLGYDVEWQLLNSKNFGVPQNRERVFIVGHLRGERTRQIFPIRSSYGKIIDDGHRCTSASPREFKWDKKVGCLQARDYKEPKIVKVAGNLGKGHETDNYYNTDGILPTLRAAVGGKTGNRAVEIRPCITPDRINKRQNGRRFKENGDPAFSLTAQDKHGVAIGSKIRKLTPTECERLQSFPDGWTTKGINKDGNEVEISDTQKFQQMGNSITVNVLREIYKKYEI